MTGTSPVAATREWRTCQLGHQHVDDRPSLSVVVVDGLPVRLPRVLLVPGVAGWAPPVTPMPAASSSATIAALTTINLLRASAFDVHVLAGVRSEPCERRGLRIHLVALREDLERPAMIADADGDPSQWWANYSEVRSIVDQVPDEMTRRTLRELVGEEDA